MASSEVRRIGYYVFKPDGTFDAAVGQNPLSDAFLSEFRGSIKAIYDVQPILNAFDILNLTHKDLHNNIKHIEKGFSAVLDAPFGGLPIIYDTHVAMLQRVMNFLSAVRAFVDHTETQLVRVHGKQSGSYKCFKESLQCSYDNKFSYRFLYELRQMSQHVAVPISLVRINWDKKTSQTPHAFHVELSMKRDDLLETWTKWKPRVRKDIEQQPLHFDLLPLIDEQVVSLREICRVVFESRAEDLRTAIGILFVLLSHIKPPHNGVPVFWKGNAVGDSVPPGNVEILPMELARKIIDILGWASMPLYQPPVASTS